MVETQILVSTWPVQIVAKCSFLQFDPQVFHVRSSNYETIGRIQCGIIMILFPLLVIVRLNLVIGHNQSMCLVEPFHLQ